MLAFGEIFVRTAQNEHELEAFIETWKDVADYYAVSDYSNWAPESTESARLFPSRPLTVLTEFRCPQPWQ